MPAPRDHGLPLPSRPSSTAKAAVRLVSNRLALADFGQGRLLTPPSTLAWPPWPASPTIESASTNNVSHLESVVAAPGSIDIAQKSLVLPNLEADVSAAGPLNPASDDSSALDPRVASPTSRPDGIVMADAPKVPGELAGIASFTDEIPGNRSVEQSVQDRLLEQSGSPMTPMIALPVNLALADPNPSSASTRSDPAAVAALIAEMPVVRGQSLAPIPNYETASPGDSNRAGTQNISLPTLTSPNDPSDFASQMGNENVGADSALDLIKTNELLQQVLEALRKRVDSHRTLLPSAGPSLYADRS